MARWDKFRKIDRNNLLIEYRTKHPEKSLAEIAEVFGISRQRVDCILKKESKRERE